MIVLVDALREDFINWGEKHEHKLMIDPNENAAYKGKRFEIFNKLQKQNPSQTVLLPAKSAMPTITVVRVKNFMTGGISSLFETTSEFVQSEVFEDSLLWQLRNDYYRDADKDRILFYGDHCWEPYFYSLFDDSVGFGSADTRVLDELDH